VGDPQSTGRLEPCPAPGRSGRKKTATKQEAQTQPARPIAGENITRDQGQTRPLDDGEPRLERLAAGRR
jgi:hypothetical protein